LSENESNSSKHTGKPEKRAKADLLKMLLDHKTHKHQNTYSYDSQSWFSFLSISLTHCFLVPKYSTFSSRHIRPAYDKSNQDSSHFSIQSVVNRDYIEQFILGVELSFFVTL
jgi:hypothetical protein